MEPTEERDAAGRVISPLLPHVYLHWFDKAFHETGGPAQWAKAKLVRYADDLVVLARHQRPGTRWVHRKEARKRIRAGDPEGSYGSSTTGRKRAWWT